MLHGLFISYSMQLEEMVMSIKILTTLDKYTWQCGHNTLIISDIMQENWLRFLRENTCEAEKYNEISRVVHTKCFFFSFCLFPFNLFQLRSFGGYSKKENASFALLLQ